jgi:pimeloyl-ACP methyl ester carboxylesterase
MSMENQTPEFLQRSVGNRVAYNRNAGQQPGVVFLHGLMSDRNGTKAMVLAGHCARQGRSCVRFDMFGHGESSGKFEDGNISRWTEDALAILDELTEGPQILVGSSMGGWVMVRAAMKRPERIAGLIGIAPGPDFTEDLMLAEFTAAQRQQLESSGVVNVQSEYDERPYPITRQLIDDGRANMVLRGPIPITCPVRLFHGCKDEAVPYEVSLRLAEKFTGEDVSVVLVKNGDHRLSTPGDLRRLCAAVDEISSLAGL